jgi:hypothetical protein
MVRIPLGGHAVEVCFDEQQLQCPASTFVTH